MADEVYANGMEVSCKAGPGKSICAFPDVCFTPPQTPATPPGVPIPYPNTSVNSDCTDGSTSVKVSGQEVMLKNKSYFKKSTGDEAGCAPKKNVVSSTNTGKVYFTAWSMDVKIEGENVVRHLDVTTHNHSNPAGEFAPWPDCSAQAPSTNSKIKPCAAACPAPHAKPLTDAQKDALRGTADYDAAMLQVNPPPGPNKCTVPTCQKPPGKLSPDHMVPLSHIKDMPGFACLSKDDQSKIANHKENMVGICRSCNSSKRDRMYPAWTGVQNRLPAPVVHSQPFLDVSEKRSKLVEKNTQTRINNAKCPLNP
jgi:uncharacterized protein DUF4150